MKRSLLLIISFFIFHFSVFMPSAAQSIEVNMGQMRKLIMAEGAITSLYVDDVDETRCPAG